RPRRRRAMGGQRSRWCPAAGVGGGPRGRRGATSDGRVDRGAPRRRRGATNDGGVDRGAPRRRRGATSDGGVDRGAPRRRRGATSDGGVGGHVGAPRKRGFEAWSDKGVTDGRAG